MQERNGSCSLASGALGFKRAQRHFFIRAVELVGAHGGAGTPGVSLKFSPRAIIAHEPLEVVAPERLTRGSAEPKKYSTRTAADLSHILSEMMRMWRGARQVCSPAGIERSSSVHAEVIHEYLFIHNTLN